MDEVSLALGAVRTTRVGFGCAGLMRLPSRREREALLHAALDAGIRHFDVARMYGLGAAERELGRFANGRRDSLVIATKFGLEPPPGSRHLGRLQGPMRSLLQCSPTLRRRIRRRTGPLPSPGTYDVPSARASLEKSLRALRTDHVELLLLHAPTPDRVPSEEICAYLEDARQAGLIGAWGVSGEPEPTAAVIRSFPVPAVTQIHVDIFNGSRQDLAGLGSPVVTFGVLATPLERIRAYLNASGRSSHWSEVVEEDCGRPEVLASLLLRDAARVNRDGTVLFATTRGERVGSAVAAVADVDRPDGSLDAFRALVSAELGPC